MKKILSLALAFGIAVSMSAATKTATFSISNMSCQNCEKKIKENLRFVNGVKDISTSLSDKTVTVVFDDTKASEEALKQDIKKVGYIADTKRVNAQVQKDQPAQKQGCGSGCCQKKDGKESCCGGKGNVQNEAKQGCCKDKAQSKTQAPKTGANSKETPKTTAKPLK